MVLRLSAVVMIKDPNSEKEEVLIIRDDMISSTSHSSSQ